MFNLASSPDLNAFLPPAAMNRRRLLQSLAAAGLASPAAHIFAKGRDDAFARSFDRFDGPLSTLPGTGFTGTLETAEISLRGRIPAGLRGTLYRNGPARFKLGTTQYEHWFDGDGMVQAFNFADGKASHKGVLLRTPKLIEEEAAGRFLYSAFGTEIADSSPVRKPDSLNVANVNLLPMNGGRELYALWEGGSALQLDPQTLTTQGFKAWSPETAGASFSAHPRRSPDGTVWNFGYAGHSGKLVIYEIDAQGSLRRQALVTAPQADMVHDFAITENYLVFLLMPLMLKPGAPQVGRLDRYEWQADAPLIAMLVSKADFSVKRFELPSGGVFHLGNAWEEGGLVRLSYARYEKFLAHLVALKLPSPQVSADKLASWVQVELNLAHGTARQVETGLNGVEFPRFDVRHTGEKTDFTVLMQNTHAARDTSNGADAVLTLTGDKLQRYSYGQDWIAEEHLYVPATGSSGKTGSKVQGWVLGTALHRTREKTTLSVFEAGQLAKGPVAQLALPYALPLGLHGQFVPA